MRAEELMTSPAITCHVNDDLGTAARRMWDHDCGVVLVVRSDGHLAGMITDRDICMAALTQGKPLHEILVNSAMSTHVVAARPDQLIEEVEHMMATAQVRRIPIVDDHKRPIGVVALNDIAREAVRSNSRLKHGVARGMRTLAEISAHRSSSADRAA
jgi:CBS domain-containing protein